MKIIFLDIDGVLNNYHFLAAKPHLKGKRTIDSDIDLNNLKVLYQILKEVPETRIVITSSWRLLKGYDFEELLNFKNYFNSTGKKDLALTKWIIGKTPYLKSIRGLEIETWLKNYSENEKINSFVILDDDKDYENLKDFWYIVNNDIGLIEEDIKPIIEILSKEIDVKSLFSI